MTRLPARPCLALPFTILGGPDRVRLLAGEDFRYTLEGPELGDWLPRWLPMLDGRHTLAEALAALPEGRRGAAREVVERLYGERVLVDGPASSAPILGPLSLLLEGEGTLRQELTSHCQQKENASERPVVVLCQDRLDYEEALRFNRRRLDGEAPWMWANCGAMSRGYVSPLFVPDAGPCLECLLGHFRRLSPIPELYADLIEHVRTGHSVLPTPTPALAVAMLAHLVRWKAELVGQTAAPAALFRLHVLDVSTLEITTHRVFADPECLACAARR